jgi:uncharacterized membrane protein YccC
VLTWLRELAATVATFDRSALEPGYALRCTVGVAIPLLVAAFLREPALGVPAAIGAFITGFTSLQGIYRTRLTAILAAAIGMCVTSFVGALAAHSSVGVITASALAGYLCAAIGQLGQAPATVALNSFVAFVLFSSQSLAPAAAAQQSALVLAGGLIQALLLLAAWLTAKSGIERGTLAEAYRNLAAYAHAIAQGAAGLPPITPLTAARQVLSDPQPFAGAGELARLRRLLEDAEIIRRRLGALAAVGASEESKIAGFANAVAAQLEAIADVLRGVSRAIRVFEPSDIRGALEAAGASDLAMHVRDAAEAAMVLSTGRLPTFQLLSAPRLGPYVHNRIDWLGRDSLRFALVAGVTMALGRHFAVDRGYWIPLTAALVLKPDFQTTFVRGVARVGGTLVGAVIASLAVLVVRGHVAAQITGTMVTAAAAYLAFNPNYAIYTVAITSFVVMVLAMRGLPGTTAIDVRVLDTLLGGALAMIGYVVFPTWAHKRTRALLADLIDAQRKLAIAVLRAYESPSITAKRAIDAARTKAWKTRTEVEASIDRSLHEPYAHHTIGPARALRILAATQRFGLATLALETALETQRGISLPGLEAFTQSLDDAMRELAQALRAARRARLDGSLQTATRSIDGQLVSTSDPKRRFVLERLRGYAEGTLRIARLTGTQRV